MANREERRPKFFSSPPQNSPFARQNKPTAAVQPALFPGGCPRTGIPSQIEKFSKISTAICLILPSFPFENCTTLGRKAILGQAPGARPYFPSQHITLRSRPLPQRRQSQKRACREYQAQQKTWVQSRSFPDPREW